MTAKREGTWKRFGARMFATAMDDNLTQIREFLAGVSTDHLPLHFLDLGCGSGENALRYAPNGSSVSGVEVSEGLAECARTHEIDVLVANVEGSIPLPDESFDAVASNQVLEHLADTDAFVSESFRLDRPGALLSIPRRTFRAGIT